MIGIVRDVDAFAHSTKTKRMWTATAFNPNGSSKAWASEGTVIVTARNSAGLLTFKVTFGDGKHCHQASLAEAEEYAESQDGFHKAR
jgi:hypothetical protein